MRVRVCLRVCMCVREGGEGEGKGSVSRGGMLYMARKENMSMSGLALAGWPPTTDGQRIGRQCAYDTRQ
eukprot:jgi/Mesvir1/6841/Mv26508-RA.1